MQPTIGGVLTMDDLAAYLKIPKATLYELAQEGRFPGHKVGRHWRFRKEAIGRWLDQAQAGRDTPSQGQEYVSALTFDHLSLGIVVRGSLLPEPAPAGAGEKRWVDGVLARKQGLGFE